MISLARKIFFGVVNHLQNVLKSFFTLTSSIKMFGHSTQHSQHQHSLYCFLELSLHSQRIDCHFNFPVIHLKMLEPMLDFQKMTISFFHCKSLDLLKCLLEVWKQVIFYVHIQTF